MKGIWKALAPTALAITMALQAAPPPGKGGGNGGGGDDGGGDPSNTPIIARFAAAGQVEGDGQGDYVDSALGNKGWSQLPGTGNFTLQLKNTGREATLHFNQQLENGAPGSVLPDDGDGNLSVQTELFMSINRKDCYDPSTGEAVPVLPSECDTGVFRNTGDGLRDMTAGQTIAASVHISMPDAYKMQCSQDPGHPLIGSGAPGENPDLDFAAVTCQQALNNGVCSEWLVRGVNYNPNPVDEADSQLRCGLYQRVGKGKSATDQHVGDFEMNFSLSLFLDVNNNGTPDQDE